jgi:hypothetical protein
VRQPTAATAENRGTMDEEVKIGVDINDVLFIHGLHAKNVRKSTEQVFRMLKVKRNPTNEPRFEARLQLKLVRSTPMLFIPYVNESGVHPVLMYDGAILPKEVQQDDNDVGNSE